MQLIIDELAQRWAREPRLRQSIVAWRWFAGAAHEGLQQAAQRLGVAAQIDIDGLCRAFFDWVRLIELHAHLEPRDPLDFRHAMAALLAQQLFATQGHGHIAGLLTIEADGMPAATAAAAQTMTATVTAAMPAATAAAAAAAATAAEAPAGAVGAATSVSAGTLITSLALTLLQALRLQLGAPALRPDPGTAASWASYLENAAQDPATAIGYLDQMCGLEPQWTAPAQIDARPALQRAGTDLRHG